MPAPGRCRPLTHYGKSKLAGEEIAFADFGGAAPEKILKKLYGYRSAIAHGGDAASAIEAIRLMVNLEAHQIRLWVHDWLRETTKTLLRCAVREPQLVSDLK